MKAFFPLVIFMLFIPRQKIPPIKFHSFLTLPHQPNKTQNFLQSTSISHFLTRFHQSNKPHKTQTSPSQLNSPIFPTLSKQPNKTQNSHILQNSHFSHTQPNSIIFTHTILIPSNQIQTPNKIQQPKKQKSKTHRNNKSQSLSRPSFRGTENVPSAERVGQSSPLYIGHLDIPSITKTIHGFLRQGQLVKPRGTGVPRERVAAEAANR